MSSSENDHSKLGSQIVRTANPLLRYDSVALWESTPQISTDATELSSSQQPSLEAIPGKHAEVMSSCVRFSDHTISPDPRQTTTTSKLTQTKPIQLDIPLIHDPKTFIAMLTTHLTPHPTPDEIEQWLEPPIQSQPHGIRKETYNVSCQFRYLEETPRMVKVRESIVIDNGTVVDKEAVEANLEAEGVQTRGRARRRGTK
ncbi:hypothetical protein B0J11DRAFT_510535 [Dendryphion nanum]|uniref:Uncharacterized protein n=1 Tax=Dendryphion nanum TaxID=256645 RepID=A0A9P9DBI2_9PLEO|nr:hypothetical protein B0J11DRAFT_510535 [Dendryphion nanum]